MKKISNRGKIVIVSVLIVLAGIMVAAALITNSVRAPEPEADKTEEARGSGDVVEDSEIITDGLSRREGVFTILVVGEDAASRSTDTIMLALFDTVEKKMNIMSIPRDTIVNVKRKIKKINGSYSANKGNIYALYDEVESVTGVRPDKYVLVTVDGFVQLIDAIGGVEIDVPIDMVYSDRSQNLTINIKKGLQTLNGYDAMGFMRYRKTYVDGDLGRIKAQHKFVDAVIKKMIKPSTFMRVPEIARIISENVDTDLTLGNEIWLGKQMLSMNLETDVKIDTLPGYADYYNRLSYYFPNRDEVLELVNERYNPYTESITKLNLFKKQ